MKGGVYKCIVCVKLDSGGALCLALCTGVNCFLSVLHVCVYAVGYVLDCIIKKCSPFVTIMLSSNTNSCIKYDYILLQLLRIYKLTSAIRATLVFSFICCKESPSATMSYCFYLARLVVAAMWQSDS